MRKALKIGLGITTVLALLYFGERAYSYISGVIGENQRLHQELIGKKKEFKKLSKHAAKLEIEYVEQKRLREKLEREFAAEKDALEGRVKVLSNATYIIREKARKSKNSDLVYKGQKLKYVVNEIRFGISGPPVGYVLIFDDGRVVSKLYNHRINVQTAVSRNEESGEYTIVSKAAYELRSPSLKSDNDNWYKKPYPLEIHGGTATIDPTERNQLAPKIHWWAPHINGGISVGAGALGAFLRPTINVSFSGYGPTKNDLDWKFLHLGFDTDTEFKYPGIHLMPFSYRFWPQVLKNTYIGPGIGWNVGGFNGQLNLSVGF